MNSLIITTTCVSRSKTSRLLVIPSLLSFCKRHYDNTLLSHPPTCVSNCPSHSSPRALSSKARSSTALLLLPMPSSNQSCTMVPVVLRMERRHGRQTQRADCNSQRQISKPLSVLLLLQHERYADSVNSVWTSGFLRDGSMQCIKWPSLGLRILGLVSGGLTRGDIYFSGNNKQVGLPPSRTAKI